VDPDEQLQTRVAWYYFVGNLTQQQIASRLGTSRVRVNRLLASCRENGIAQISINSKLASCVELEEALVSRYGLEAAVVVPTPENPAFLREAIGVGAGTFLAERIEDGMTVGIGWGRTLRPVMRNLPGRSLRDLSVVSLQGGLSHCSRINTFEIVSVFADLFDADRHYFAAPIYASSEEARDIILQQSAIRETYDKARRANLAIITAGDLEESLVITYGLDDPEDRARLADAGAVGDVLGHFIDAEGRLVDHPLNRRTVAVELDDLHGMDCVVLTTGGESKAPVIRAMLRGGYLNVLVTDENTARKVC